MNIQPANRLAEITEYYFSRKLREIRNRNSLGENILNLGIGNPDQMPPQEAIRQLIESAIETGNHGYQPYKGIPELRQAMSEWYSRVYGICPDPEAEILPLLGSKEGIMHISMAFLNPGDKVLVPNPGYPAYTSAAKISGAEVVEYDLEEEAGWLPDLENLARQTDLSKVKMMWVNYPNMPTGSYALQETLQSFVDFGREHNILVINDNPYSMVTDQVPMSILACEGAKEVALELNSLSKSHNMAGWRVGMVLGKGSYLEAILKVKSNMDSGMFLPIQKAAISAMKTPFDWHQEQNEIYHKRRKIAWQILDALGCQYDKSQSGMFVWAKIPDTEKSTEAFIDNLIDQRGLFITPGFIFGSNGESFIRISLCSPVELLQEALSRLPQLTCQT